MRGGRSAILYAPTATAIEGSSGGNIARGSSSVWQSGCLPSSRSRVRVPSPAPPSSLIGVGGSRLPTLASGIPPLLETRLHVPRPRRDAVSRSRLSELLERGADAKLLLVSAPAGFDKTTLLARWLATPARNREVAWLSLDGVTTIPPRSGPTWWLRFRWWRPRLARACFCCCTRRAGARQSSSCAAAAAGAGPETGRAGGLPPHLH